MISFQGRYCWALFDKDKGFEKGEKAVHFQFSPLRQFIPNKYQMFALNTEQCL